MSMKASPIVHALPYPALEAGNLSFPTGEYKVSTQVGKDGYSVEVEHQISGAPFLESLIADGVAQFGCLFSIPKVGVRRLDLTDTKKQTICWDTSILGEPPKLRPVLLYTGAEREYKFTKKHGVAEIWQGKKALLPEGAKLARASFFNITSSEYHFLRFKNKPEYASGSFNVEANTEEGFYFNILAAQDVYDLVQNPGKDAALRLAVLTSAVSRCFEILKEKYREREDDSNESLSNLTILREKLNTEYGCDWNDEDFDPCLAASKLYPIQIPASAPYQENEDDE